MGATETNKEGNISVDSLSASIEKLKAESEANSEIRKMNSERFSQISEQIGELRAMINLSEKSRQSLEIKAEKAAGLVESVQPEKLMMNLQKTDFKAEALKAKLEANELINSKIKDDLRDMRSKFAVFRNLEMVKDLNEDSKKRFNELKKIEIQVIKHSDKADSIFNELEKSVRDSKDAVKGIKDLSDSLRKTISDVDSLKTQIKMKSSKEDITKVDKELKAQTTKVVGIVHKELDEYKDKMLKDIEVAAKKKELQVIKDLVRDDFKQVGEGFIDFKHQYEKMYSKEASNEKKIDMLLDLIKLLSVKNNEREQKRIAHNG